MQAEWIRGNYRCAFRSELR